MPQLAMITPPTMATRVPTVAEVKPMEEAPSTPISSSAEPTAAAVPKPPMKPTGSIMPNHGSVPNTGAKTYRPSRMNRPHWPMNMAVE